LTFILKNGFTLILIIIGTFILMIVFTFVFNSDFSHLF
jgi:hypothetical protein